MSIGPPIPIENLCVEAIQRVEAERDTAQAEVERLRATLAAVQRHFEGKPEIFSEREPVALLARVKRVLEGDRAT